MAKIAHIESKSIDKKVDYLEDIMLQNLNETVRINNEMKKINEKMIVISNNIGRIVGEK